MNKILFNFVSKDIKSIIGKYLLPNQDKLKNIITNNFHGYLRGTSSIQSQYVYFQLRTHTKLLSINEASNPDYLILIFTNDDVNIFHNISDFNAYSVSLKYGQIDHYIPIINVFYEDIKKFGSLYIKNKWTNTKKSTKYLIN